MKRFLSTAVAVAVLSLASVASAAGLQLWIFDPDELGGTSSAKVENMGCNRKSNGEMDKGLVLFKLGATSENKAAGATLTGLSNKNMCSVNAFVSFQFRPQGHCGAGAPRFNIVTKDNVLHFIGCAAMTQTAVDPDTGCVTASANVHNAAQTFPIIPTGSGNACLIKSIEVVMDEGTDQGVGFAVLDNFEINGVNVDVN